MINLIEACEIAKKEMSVKWRVNGFTDIRETSEKWLFEANYDGEGPGPFGNLPHSVEKKNGKCEIFPMFAPGNFTTYLEAKQIEIPDEYKVKAS